MNIPTANRIAHQSSFCLSCILNFLLFMGILHWAGSEPVTPPGKDVFKLLPNEDPIIIEDPEPEIPDDDLREEHAEKKTPTPELPPVARPEWGDPDPVQPVSFTILPPLLTDNVGVLELTGIYEDRGDEKRGEALIKYLPPTVAALSEPGVVKALDWLQAHQHKNGAWTQSGNPEGGGFNAGYTGLALLTFLAHGETPASEKYGVTVAKGIRFLVEYQDAQGVFHPAGSHTAYGHAIATYALAEAYLMTENPLLRAPLERAAQVIMNGQMPHGGFDYEYKQENRNDLSLGAWHVQALKAVSLTDVADEKLKAHLQLAMDGMLLGSKKIQDRGRGFTYNVINSNVGAPRRIISSAGTLGLFLSGRGNSREAKESLKYLEQFCESDQLPLWGNPDLKPEHGGEIMFWYYTVQAFFQADPHGRQFKQFVHAMVTELARHQEEDGRWTGFTEKGIHQGPVFNTTLGALSLMTCYRYNLESGPATEPASSPEKDRNPDDVVFEI